MRIYVEKVKGIKIGITLLPESMVKGYDLVFDDGKEVIKQRFKNPVELITYLSKRPIYDGKMFPVELLSIKEFVTLGYSLYM